MKINSYSRLLLWLAPLTFLGVFFFYPFIRILAFGLNFSTFQPSNFQLALHVLLFTFYQAILSTLLTLLIGLPSAYLFARFDFHGKSLLRALTTVPFMLPTVVVAAGFNALLGPRGWINVGVVNLFSWLHQLPVTNSLFPYAFSPIPFVGTLSAILIAHVFYNTTIVIRLVGNALSNLDPKLEHAARSLGANNRRVWWNVILPLLRPSIFAASLLVFLFDFTSFGVILLLGGPSFATLEVEIYIQALQILNLPLAALLAFIQLLCTLIFSILYTSTLKRVTVQSSPRSVDQHKAKTIREKIFVAAFCFLLTAFFILPMLALPLRSVSRLDADRGQPTQVHYGLTTDYYTELFVNRTNSLFYVPPVQAALNSLGYAIATVFLSLVLGFPAAAALAKPGRLERILDPILILPLGASAVTLALGFIIAFGRLLISPWMVPLAHTLVALPFVIRTLQPAISSIPDRLRQAARTLGASPFRVWQNVDLPILSRAALSAATFAFTISLGEFGATLLLARPDYPTIPIAIYRFLSLPGASNYGQAMAMATLLMALTTVSIMFIEKQRLPGAGDF
jgi:thiamine transport system permease protein